MRVASASTNPSSSASGKERFTYPWQLSPESPGDIVRAQQNLRRRTPSAHQTWQPRHGAATGHEGGADFPLGQDSLFRASYRIG